jgi:hypothetical protein
MLFFAPTESKAFRRGFLLRCGGWGRFFTAYSVGATVSVARCFFGIRRFGFAFTLV